MPNFKISNSIDIDGEDYELRLLTCITHSHNYPYVMIDGKPVISIEFYGDKPASEEAIDRARISIESFKASGGKYCSIPDMSLDYDKKGELDLSKISKETHNIDLYNQFNVPHMLVESKDNDDYSRWAVFDIELCRELHDFKHTNEIPDYSPFG